MHPNVTNSLAPNVQGTAPGAASGPGCVRCGSPGAQVRGSLVRASASPGLRFVDGFVCTPCVAAWQRGSYRGETLRLRTPLPLLVSGTA